MMNQAEQLARKARTAARLLAAVDIQNRNGALQRVAEALIQEQTAIAEANQRDIARSKTEGLAAPLLKRLLYDEDKIQASVAGIKDLIGLADPLGRLSLDTELDDGLVLRRISCPIGVIGIIFESRPDALVQISTLCLKSGNCVLLKGGSEALETNRILTAIIDRASQQAGLPDGWIQLLETRDDVMDLLSLDEEVDLLIPRGSNEFVRYIMDHTRIPVLGHADGVCHLFIDESADPDMAIRLAIDSKTQYVAVCNTTETILLHQQQVDRLLLPLVHSLRQAGVTIYGCPRVCDQIGCEPVVDWHTEYLDYKVSMKIVDSLEEAIDHINRYNSGHTEAIVTADPGSALRFEQLVDSGNIFWNCSTRFSDGYRYGFGAEVGISTAKIHARGPVGLEGLTTYKYLLEGNGHIVADYSNGNRQFTHRDRSQRI
jgi:glutamate-5-semialdehyde dehydrogenase